MNKESKEPVYSKRLKAGKRRTYFFDIRSTKSNDFYLTITESKKKFTDDGYDRHKIFLYKEDFNKFMAMLTETVDYVKTELLPEYNYDEFAHYNDEYEEDEERREPAYAAVADSATETKSDEDLTW